MHTLTVEQLRRYARKHRQTAATATIRRNPRQAAIYLNWAAQRDAEADAIEAGPNHTTA